MTVSLGLLTYARKFRLHCYLDWHFCDWGNARLVHSYNTNLNLKVLDFSA